ncbi:MAG: hypothetical protein AAGA93_26575, partial [Actinomycetota bacterium]
MSGITLVSGNPRLEAVFVEEFGRSTPVRRVWSDQWHDPAEVAMDACAADPELVVIGSDAGQELTQVVVPEIDRLFPATTILCLTPRVDTATSMTLLRLGARDVAYEGGTRRDFRASIEPVLQLAHSRHQRRADTPAEVRRR